MRNVIATLPEGTPLKYRISDAVHEMELEGEHVLIHLDTEELFSLDDVGQIVWKHVKNNLNMTEIVRQVCIAFDNTVSTAEVTPDVSQLLNHLVNSGLILPASD